MIGKPDVNPTDGLSERVNAGVGVLQGILASWEAAHPDDVAPDFEESQTLSPEVLSHCLSEDGPGWAGVLFMLALSGLTFGQSETDFIKALKKRQVVYAELVEHLEDAREQLRMLDLWPWENAYYTDVIANEGVEG